MSWAIHAIIISKSIPKAEATKIAQEIINNPKRTFVREETNTYRYRNLSKQKFDKFRTHTVNDDIHIVMGQLKSIYKHLK